MRLEAVQQTPQLESVPLARGCDKLFKPISPRSRDTTLRSSLGRKKLDDYCGLSEETSAHLAAVLVYPEHRLEWFQNHWGEKTAWLREVKFATRLFQDYLARHPVPPPQPEKEINDLERLNKRQVAAVVGANELDRYLDSPIEDVIIPLVVASPSPHLS